MVERWHGRQYGDGSWRGPCLVCCSEWFRSCPACGARSAPFMGTALRVKPARWGMVAWSYERRGATRAVAAAQDGRGLRIRLCCSAGLGHLPYVSASSSPLYEDFAGAFASFEAAVLAGGDYLGQEWARVRMEQNRCLSPSAAMVEEPSSSAFNPPSTRSGMAPVKRLVARLMPGVRRVDSLTNAFRAMKAINK